MRMDAFVILNVGLFETHTVVAVFFTELECLLYQAKDALCTYTFLLRVPA